MNRYDFTIAVGSMVVGAAIGFAAMSGIIQRDSVKPVAVEPVICQPAWGGNVNP